MLSLPSILSPLSILPMKVSISAPANMLASIEKLPTGCFVALPVFIVASFALMVSPSFAKNEFNGISTPMLYIYIKNILLVYMPIF